MFQRLFTRNHRPDDSPPRPEGRVPPGTRVYAVGDVHGRLDLLTALERLIEQDRESQPADRHLLVYLGDYIDRGYESRAVIDHMMAPPLPGFERICLKGNHEDFLLKFMEDLKVGPIWLVNGGRETVLSYGVTPPVGLGFTEDTLEQIRAGLKEKIPPSHLAFMASLRLSHREGDFLFVHAGVRPGVPVEAQNENDLLWIRDLFLKSKQLHGCIVVHGHTPTAEPEVRTNRIGIDTGAFASGHLTCLVLEDDHFRFLRT